MISPSLGETRFELKRGTTLNRLQTQLSPQQIDRRKHRTRTRTSHSLSHYSFPIRREREEKSFFVGI